MKNLIICKTTYQCKFALDIINRVNIKRFDFISISENQDFLNNNDFKCLKSRAENYYEIKLKSNNSIFDHLYFIYSARKFFYYERIFFSSIDNLIIQLIVSRNNNCQLITFDDGSVNFIKSSMFYKDMQSYVKKNLYKLFGNIHSIASIKEKISIHYSTKNYSNIVPVEKLKVVKFKSDIILHSDFSNLKKDIPVLFIGSNFNELLKDPKLITSRIESVLSQHDYIYIPHPRNNNHYGFEKKINKLNFGVSAEDVINKYLSENERVMIIGLPSSVFINFIDDYRVIKEIISCEGYSENFCTVTNSMINLIKNNIDNIITIR